MRPLGWIAGALLVAGLTFEARPVAAYTGNELLQDCEASEDDPNYWQKDMFCLGYIAGVIEGWNTAQAQYAEKPMTCTPTGLTHRQAGLVVLKYMRAHPEELHEAARSLIFRAIYDAFPCK